MLKSGFEIELFLINLLNYTAGWILKKKYKLKTEHGSQFFSFQVS